MLRDKLILAVVSLAVSCYLSVAYLPHIMGYIVISLCCSAPILALIATRVIYRRRIGHYSGDHKLTGKTVLVTGGTNGIGYQTSLDLAKRNAKTVIITGRDEEKGRKVCREIQSLTGNSNIDFLPLDLSDLDGVRKFAQNVAAKYPVIDILINNAACSLSSRELTSDGHEKTMASNYFGPFLLTETLLPNLKSSEQGRIINLSSLVYKFAKLDLNNLDFKEDYLPFQAYATSKLANLLYTRHSARLLHQEGSSVTVNAVHPGIVSTGLFREAPPLLQKVMTWGAALLFKSASDGAQTSIFCAVEPDLSMVSGVYFEDCNANFNLLPVGRDDALAKLLFEKTELLCGIGKKSD